MDYNYQKLRGRIKEICGTQQEFANKIDCSERTLSHKLNSKKEWKQNEILRAIEILELTICDIPLYFFTEKVQKN